MSSISNSDLTILRLQMLRDFGYEPIDELLRGIAQFAATEHKELTKHAKQLLADPPEGVEKAWLRTFHDDDHYFLEEAKKLSLELAIVALYKKIEIDSKRAIVTAFPGISEPDLFKIAKVKKVLKGKGIDITTLSQYDAMDEVRCINNSIKHNGYVNTELSAFPGWVFKQPLANLDEAYHRLAPLSALYIADLIDALIRKHKSKKRK